MSILHELPCSSYFVSRAARELGIEANVACAVADLLCEPLPLLGEEPPLDDDGEWVAWPIEGPIGLMDETWMPAEAPSIPSTEDLEYLSQWLAEREERETLARRAADYAEIRKRESRVTDEDIATATGGAGEGNASTLPGAGTDRTSPPVTSAGGLTFDTETRPMPYYDTEETDEAVRLYRSHARRRGLIACQPDRDLTRREGDVIHIRNANGDLARYRILPDGRIVKTG